MSLLVTNVENIEHRILSLLSWTLPEVFGRWLTGVFVLQLPNLKSAVRARTSCWSGTCSWTAEVTPNRPATPEVRHPQIRHKNHWSRSTVPCFSCISEHLSWNGVLPPVTILKASPLVGCSSLFQLFVWPAGLTVGSPGNSNGVCFFFYGFYILSAVFFYRQWRERLHDTGQLRSSGLELLLHRLL